jgi:hypothetical protein
VKCGEEGCDRQSRSRGLCAFHYKRAQRAGLGKLVRSKPREHTPLEIVCQQGKNPACVDCGVPPLFGGMRCLDCFQRRCEAVRQTVPHMFDLPSSYSTYSKGCRCRECTDHAAAAKARNRRRKAAA